MGRALFTDLKNTSMDQRITNFFRKKTLKFQVDFSALSEISDLFQTDVFLQTFVAAAKLLSDVQKQLYQDFNCQVQKEGGYRFDEKDEYECKRDLNLYAQASTAVQRAFKNDAASVDFSMISDGLMQDGFSVITRDLIWYLLLQTRMGMPNLLCGSLQRACLALFDPFKCGFEGKCSRSRILHVYKSGGNLIGILMEQATLAQNVLGEINYLMKCRVELQVDSKLKILIRSASFTVHDPKIAAVVYQQLINRKFIRIDSSATEMVFNLDRKKIHTLIQGSNNEAAKIFMRLLRVYATLERKDYQSELPDGRNGVIGLCLDFIKISIQCNHELGIFLFALDKLLTLLEDAAGKEKFDKELVPPQLFALPHFSSDVMAVVHNHEDQFINYLSSLAADDITEANIEAIALILAQLFLSRREAVITEVFQCLGRNAKLVELFLLKLKCDQSVYDEFLECLKRLRFSMVGIDASWFALSSVIEVMLSEEQCAIMFGRQMERLSAIENLIQDILTEVKNVILLSDKVTSGLSLDWNNVVMNWLERELRSRLKEQVEISPFFLQLLVLPYNLTADACDDLTKNILEKIDAFKRKYPLLARVVQPLPIAVAASSATLPKP